MTYVDLRGTGVALKSETIQDAEELKAILEQLSVLPDWKIDTAKFMAKLMKMHDDMTVAYSVIMEMYAEKGISLNIRYRLGFHKETQRTYVMSRRPRNDDPTVIEDTA